MQKGADALLVAPRRFFARRRVQLATLAVHHTVAAIYAAAEYVKAVEAGEREPRRGAVKNER